jgi:hypothetical protein
LFLTHLQRARQVAQFFTRQLINSDVRRDRLDSPVERKRLRPDDFAQQALEVVSG